MAGVAPVLSCAVAHQGQVKEGARCYNSEKAFSQTLAIPVQRICIVHTFDLRHCSILLRCLVRCTGYRKASMLSLKAQLSH